MDDANEPDAVRDGPPHAAVAADAVRAAEDARRRTRLTALKAER